MEMTIRELATKLHSIHDIEPLRKLASILAKSGISIPNTRGDKSKSLARKIERALRDLDQSEVIYLDGFEFPVGGKPSRYQIKLAERNRQETSLPKPEPESDLETQTATKPQPPTRAAEAGDKPPARMSFREFVDTREKEDCGTFQVKGENWTIEAELLHSPMKQIPLIRIIRYSGPIPKGTYFSFEVAVALFVIRNGYISVPEVSVTNDAKSLERINRITTACYFRKLYEMREAVGVVFDW